MSCIRYGVPRPAVEHALLEDMSPPTAPKVHPGLLGREYTDPAVLEEERDRIFFRNWFTV